MKKLLLFSAMALGMATASAESFSDAYSVTYEGKEVQNGAFIYSENWDAEAGWFLADFDFKLKGNRSSATLKVLGEYTGTPSYDTSLANPYEWGTPSICYDAGSAGSNCVPNQPPIISTFELNTTDPIEIQFHVLSGGNEEINPDVFDPSDPSTYPGYIKPTETSQYLLTFEATVDGAKLSDSFTINVVLGANAHVDGIQADSDVQAVYYDLAGRRVLNPAKGQLVIERKGAKAVKKIMM